MMSSWDIAGVSESFAGDGRVGDAGLKKGPIEPSSFTASLHSLAHGGDGAGGSLVRKRSRDAGRECRTPLISRGSRRPETPACD
jgi:hypothetical protein